jgi:hypothetical protein
VDSRTYELFGLTLESQLPLPEGLAAGSGTPDVRLQASSSVSSAKWRALDDTDNADWFACRRLPDGSTCLRWTGLFDFWISADGALIEYRKHRRASLESFTVYFLGHVLSFSLLARGNESLHGSAVAVNGRAVVFLGECGSGKSTLAAAMIARGYPVITDDVVVLRRLEGRWLLQPGAPRLKLFPATARKLLGARDSSQMNTGTTKLVIPLGQDEAIRQPLPVESLYLLRTAEKTRGDTAIRIDPVDGANAFLGIVRSAFNVVIADRDRLASQFGFAQQLASSMRVRQLTYPRRMARLGDVCNALIADVAVQ